MRKNKENLADTVFILIGGLSIPIFLLLFLGMIYLSEITRPDKHPSTKQNSNTVVTHN
jgi:hypothetical protein